MRTGAFTMLRTHLAFIRYVRALNGITGYNAGEKYASVCICYLFGRFHFRSSGGTKKFGRVFPSLSAGAYARRPLTADYPLLYLQVVCSGRGFTTAMSVCHISAATVSFAIGKSVCYGYGSAVNTM